MKIGLDLAEILRISKLDWRDGGEGEEGEKKGRRRRGGILLCNGLIGSKCTNHQIIKLWNYQIIK